MPSQAAAKQTEFYDCQDDLLMIAAYEDIGVGPAVVFDGGAFTDPKACRRFADDMRAYADWLDAQKSGASPSNQQEDENDG